MLREDHYSALHNVYLLQLYAKNRVANQLIDDTIMLIARKGKVSAREIQRNFDISRDLTNKVIEFLTKFGIAQVDKKDNAIRITNTYRLFLEEEIRV